jgi:hypothetical protein
MPLNSRTKVPNALDDVAGSICLSLESGDVAADVQLYLNEEVAAAAAATTDSYDPVAMKAELEAGLDRVCRIIPVLHNIETFTVI